jgi:plastocyanin
VLVHDFPDNRLGKAIPYGVYDLGAKTGSVSVGSDHDTAGFAVASLRRWWETMGKALYRAADRLLVTADAEGSNGYRVRLWRPELARFAAETGLTVHAELDRGAARSGSRSPTRNWPRCRLSAMTSTANGTTPSRPARAAAPTPRRSWLGCEDHAVNRRAEFIRLLNQVADEWPYDAERAYLRSLAASHGICMTVLQVTIDQLVAGRSHPGMTINPREALPEDGTGPGPPVYGGSGPKAQQGPGRPRKAQEVTMPRRRLRLLVLVPVLAAMVLAGAPPAAAGGGCHRPPSEGRGDTLTLTDLCFSPTVLRVAPGTKVTIVNRDQFEHPLGRPGGAWSWDGGAGDQTAVRLEAAGVYPFFCYVHPGMVGVVVVGDGRGSGGATTADLAVTKSAPIADASTGPAEPTASRPIEASLPPAWLVVVALAALLGALGGARLATRHRR